MPLGAPFARIGTSFGDSRGAQCACLGGVGDVFYLPIRGIFLPFLVLCAEVSFLGMSQPVCLFLHLPGVPFLYSKVNISGLGRRFSLCLHKKEPSEDFLAVRVNWDNFGSLPERFAVGRISQSRGFGRMSLAKSWFCCPRYLRLLTWRLRFCSVCKGSQLVPRVFIASCRWAALLPR